MYISFLLFIIVLLLLTHSLTSTEHRHVLHLTLQGTGTKYTHAALTRIIAPRMSDNLVVLLCECCEVGHICT